MARANIAELLKLFERSTGGGFDVPSDYKSVGVADILVPKTFTAPSERAPHGSIVTSSTPRKPIDEDVWERYKSLRGGRSLTRADFDREFMIDPRHEDEEPRIYDADIKRWKELTKTHATAVDGTGAAPAAPAPAGPVPRPTAASSSLEDELDYEELLSNGGGDF